MSFSKQKVRSACEECHSRKIRCHISPEAGSCKACRDSARECYFKLKVKSGRPPKELASKQSSSSSPSNPSTFTTHDNSRSNSASPPKTDDMMLLEDIDQHPHDSMNTFHPLPSANSGFFGDNFPESFGYNTEMLPQNIMNIFSYPDSVAATPKPLETLNDGSRPTSMGQWSAFDVKSDIPALTALSSNSGSSYNNPPSRPFSPQYALPWETASYASQQDSPGLIGLLMECLDLHNYVQKLRQADGNLAALLPRGESLQNISKMVKRSCESVSRLLEAGEGITLEGPMLNLDTSLMSLVLASKVLEMCEVVIQAIGLNPLSLEDMVAVKRLEYNLLDLRLSLSQVKGIQPLLSVIVEDVSEKLASCNFKPSSAE